MWRCRSLWLLRSVGLSRPHHLIIIWSREILTVCLYRLTSDHLRRHVIPGLITCNSLLPIHYILIHFHRLSHNHSLRLRSIRRHHLLRTARHLTSNLLTRTRHLRHPHLWNSSDSWLTNKSRVLLNEILSVNLLSRVWMPLHSNHLLLLLEDNLVRILISLDNHILRWHSLLLLLLLLLIQA